MFEQRGLAPTAWHINVTYHDNVPDSVLCKENWTVEQLTQVCHSLAFPSHCFSLEKACLQTETALSNKARTQLIAMWVPKARVPTLTQATSQSRLLPNFGTWGRWLSPHESVHSIHILFDTNCVALRKREWKLKIKACKKQVWNALFEVFQIGYGTKLASTSAFVNIDPFATVASIQETGMLILSTYSVNGLNTYS